MCSIVGYRGNSFVAPVLVESLKAMEYRGYDSVGIATFNDDRIQILKGIGKVNDVNRTLKLAMMPGYAGIGHTRWATHGAVTSKNAHPHSGCSEEIAVVHNGIIENYTQLKGELMASGHTFTSETDSEVISHLLEKYYSEQRDVKKAMIQTCQRLMGSYAFVAIFRDGTISGARYEEPLIIGLANDAFFISSDVLGFLKYTDKAIFLDNRNIAIIDKQLRLFDFEGAPIVHPVTQVAWELGASDKGKYAHHTLKEIHEQPLCVMSATLQNEERTRIFCNILARANAVYITGSGTSYHAALVAKYLLAKFAKIRAESVMSSEFQYVLDFIDKDSVLVALSQSGETADVLHSVKEAKQAGAKVLSIVNIPTSSLARNSDSFLSINCGPEIGVAATKSFTGQLSVLYHIVNLISGSKIGFESDKQQVSTAIEHMLGYALSIETIAESLKEAKDIYIVGRSIHYPVALEAALKIKELTYIHAEAIAAGELKHGPLALIDKSSSVIIINPSDATYDDMISSAHEIKARGATLIGVSNLPNDVYDKMIQIPEMKDVYYPIIEVIPLQLLAYSLAVTKNTDPDYPRNLAKSVTVR
jgi:glucosamine--fructose-6-phosphate aminotransferase (isomerizing)